MKNKKIIIIFLTLIILFLVSIFYTNLFITNTSITSKFLKNKVEISIDNNDISYINAQNLYDTYFAIGFIHAKDRLWQMDLLRRNASGRLSEIFGKQSIPYDKFIKLLDFEEKAEHDLKLLSKECLKALEAYAEGVNSYIKQETLLSPEFYILNYSPEPWKPKDSFMIAKLMSVNLSGNWWKILLRGLLANKNIPPEEVMQFWIPEDISYTEAVTLVESNYKLFPKLITDNKKTSLNHEIKNHPASNAWVINGSHTVTGKPLLANDPHVMLTAPSQWYLMNIKINDYYTITGATIPGIPFIVIGHNNNIAWGITATGSDVQDLFIEKLGKENSYFYDKTYKPLEIKYDTIKVKNTEQINFTKRYTIHGPLISDINDFAASLVDDKHGVALSYVALEKNDLTLQALYELNFAKNWQEFTFALRNFITPHLNFLYADTNNNIGTIAPGKFPIRNNKISFFPMQGWDSKSSWKGYISANNILQNHNPPSGIIINANNKITTRSKDYYLGFVWEPKYRAQRIYNLLNDKKYHSVESFKIIQNDTFFPLARDYIQFLSDIVPTSTLEKEAIEKLKNWDLTFDKNKSEPLIFETWLNEMRAFIFSNNLMPKLDIFLELKPEELKFFLNKQSIKCPTLVNNNCHNITNITFKNTISKMKEKYGTKIDNWQWGEEHKAYYVHHVFDNIPILNKILKKSIPTSGNNYTINCSVSNPTNTNNPFTSVYGSSFRVIYDLANLKNSQFIITPGQSGNIFSDSYDNLLRVWSEGKYITIDDNSKLMTRHIILLPS
jgi:penicillin amidase